MSDPFSYSEQTTTSASSLSNASSSIIEITDSEETYQSSTQDIAPLRRPWKRRNTVVASDKERDGSPIKKSSKGKQREYPYGRVLVPPTSDDWDSPTYLEEEARRGIRLAFSDPSATEKSPEQLEYLR
jgi:hypothetical protein